MTVTVEVPIATVNPTNRREHWGTRAKRVKAQRGLVGLALRTYNVYPRRLNEDTPKLDAKDPKALHWHVVGCIAVLDGDAGALTDDERKRVRVMRAEWLRLRR